MSTALRPRVDATVILVGQEDKPFEVSTTLRDQLDLKKALAPRQPTGDGEDIARMVYFAMRRCGYYSGTWDDFVDDVSDLEVRTPAPLARGGDSPDNSPLLPEPQE